MKRRTLALTLIMSLLVSLPLITSFPFIHEAAAMPQLRWSKTYNGSSGLSATQTTDKGYIIVGVNGTDPSSTQPLIIKTDSSGNVLWEKTLAAEFFSAQSIVQTSDGGYALSGWGGWLMKIDAEGNILWHNHYDYMERCVVVQTSDNGYALTGYVDSATIENDAIMVKTDGSGGLIWRKSVSGNLTDVLALNFVQTSEGDFVVVGVAGGDFWFAKVEANGNLQWNKTLRYSNDFNRFYSLTSVAKTQDAGFILSGVGGVRAWLIKVESNGNTQWSYGYQPSMFGFHSAVQLSDGGYLAGGKDINNLAMLFRTDSNGNTVWNATYGELNGSQSQVSSVIATDDGGYAVAGFLNGSVWLAKFAPESSVIPEFPSLIILPLFVTETILVTIVYFKKRKR